jgi:signal transduction histidine kinase
MGTSDESDGNEQPNTGESPEEQRNPSTTSADETPPSLSFIGTALPETLASLGHEVRAPLAIIDGYTSTLLSHGGQLSPSEHVEFLQVIQHATRRLEHVTDQLLQIAHLEAGLIQLDQSVIDLSKLARAAVGQAKRLLPEGLRGRMCLVVECRDARGKRLKTPALVRGDLHRLRQVVEHLVQNAVKYSPEGGRIEVIVRPAPEDGRSTRSGEATSHAFWELCVCDVGVGIPEQHLERIFEPFYRVDTRLTREQYGLGVGLAACRHLAHLHHGRIWAESCPDGGSAFHLRLPLARALADQ